MNPNSLPRNIQSRTNTITDLRQSGEVGRLHKRGGGVAPSRVLRLNLETPTLTPAKPPLLKALTNPASYRQELQAFKRARYGKHHDRLLNELRRENPDPKAVKRAFTKLASAGKSTSGGYVQPVPEEANERDAMVKDCRLLQQGIAKTLQYLPERTHAQSYLQQMNIQLDRKIGRVDAVEAYEQEAVHASEALQLAIESSSGSKQATKLSDEGGTGALLQGTRLRRDTLAIGTARREGMEPHPLELHDEVIDDDSTESLVDDLSENETQISATAQSGEQPRAAGASFQKATPRQQPVKYESVLKIEANPEASKDAMRIYGVADYLATHAGHALPFAVGHHLLIQPDETQKTKILNKLSTANTAQDRATKLAEQKNALENGSPVLVQQFLPGKMMASASVSVDERKALVSQPSSCKAMGASAVICPLVGLGDHFAVNGAGANNWTNVMVNDGRLAMIDLSPRRPSANQKGFDEVAMNAMKALVSDLKSLAKKVGGDGVLPAGWFDLIKDSTSDLFDMTFTDNGSLFQFGHFYTDDERGEREQLGTRRGELRSLDELTPEQSQELKKIDARLKAILSAAERRSDETLKGVKDAAAPHVIAGLIQGINWFLNNADSLIAAHHAANEAVGDGQSLLSAEQVVELRQTFSQLTSAENDKLRMLKAPLPQGQVIKA